MPAKFEREAGDTYVLKLNGTLLASEFRDAQTQASVPIGAGGKLNILTVLEDFEGFERGADWGEIETLFSHGNQVERIAVVGDPRWERDALAFTGAGLRKAPVKFFPPDQLQQARAWLAE